MAKYQANDGHLTAQPMEIKIECPACQQHLAVDESWRGRLMDCPACGSNLQVPEASKTRVKYKPGKKTYILGSVIGFLVLAGALAIFFWKHSAQKPPPYAVRKTARRIAATSTQPALVGNAPWVAARSGNLPKLKQILDEHPEVLNQHYGGVRTTMLIAAANRGRANTLEELLNRNADVNARTLHGDTALYACISGKGTKEMAEMLLDHKADFTIADSDGKTPLKLAIEKNRQDMVDLLQQHGAKE
jgi:uncharacterized protein